MTTDWEYLQEIKRWHEKDELFQLSDAELASKPVDVQYTHMRYVREIEAYEFIRLLRAGYLHKNAAINARKSADNIVKNWNAVKKHPSTWV